MKYFFTVIIAFICITVVTAQKFNGLATTPPLGWNSWNKFACDVDENLIKATADAMVSSGMREAGYEYIVIDDCWHGERDSLGFIHPDPNRFPSGIKSLADYIHSKGLKFGIYSDAGWQTCGGKPGSRGREYQDAMTYASWGVDYLKYDWCNTDGLSARGAYLTMRDALHEAGRPIVLSICEWGTDKPWEWGSEAGHLWRISGDIYNCFDCEYDHGTWSSWGVLQILDMRKGIRQYNGPDHWNDPDMMEVGNGMSVNEDRAHFSLWAMLAAPLIAGNDLRDMSEGTRLILTNKEVLAIDQDSLGIQAFRYLQEGDLDIWVKPLVDGELAVCFLNRSENPYELTFDWQKHSIEDPDFEHQFTFKKQVYKLHNVWTSRQQGSTKKVLKAAIPGHDVLMFRLSKE